MCRINSAVNFSAQRGWLQTVPVVKKWQSAFRLDFLHVNLLRRKRLEIGTVKTERD